MSSQFHYLFFFFIKDARVVEGKEERTKQMSGKAIQELKRELSMLHGENVATSNALAGKLAFVVRQTIKRIVDGEQTTEEEVKELIDMDKLAFRCSNLEKTEENNQRYSAAVLHTCKKTL